MTKITVDKALLEQALDALENHHGNYKLSQAACKKQEVVEGALRAALAQAAMGACCVCTNRPPPPAEVPLLTEDELKYLLSQSDLLDMLWNIGWYSALATGFKKHGATLIRNVEQAVRQKAGLA